jgi:hypothetical protein
MMDKTRLRAALAAMGMVAVLATGLPGCAVLEPARELTAGQTEAEVTQRMGLPNARHAMPGGLTRLEFARGPAGRTTWMVDLGADGRVAAFAQVLNDANFLAVHSDMSRDELLRLLGRPAHRQGEWMGKETWSWRYPTNDCLWFRVTLGPDGRTLGGGGHMPDPACDVNDKVRD